MVVRRTMRLNGCPWYGLDGNPGFGSQDVGNGALYRDGLTLFFSLSYPRLYRCRRFESKRQEDANIPTRMPRFLSPTHKYMVGCCCSISTNAGQGQWWCFRLESNLGFPRLASATVQSTQRSPFFVLEESENSMAIYETDGSGHSRIGGIRHG